MADSSQSNLTKFARNWTMCAYLQNGRDRLDRDKLAVWSSLQKGRERLDRDKMAVWSSLQNGRERLDRDKVGSVLVRHGCFITSL